MGDWKELGEIPDSEDDEGFDSQLSTARSIPTNLDILSNHTTIWDIPDSPGDVSIKPPQLPTSSLLSSPLSSILSEDGLPPIEEFAIGGGRDQNAASSELGVIHSTALRNSQSQVATALSPSPANQPHHISTEEHSLTDKPLEWGLEAEHIEARQAAIRSERSLRPRKPIQEHPYLLENAQYSSFLRLHGVKPVRMAIERRKQLDELAPSQDEEFQEESQDSGAFNFQDSWLPDLNDPSTEFELLDVAPSTPLRQTPGDGRASSPRSSLGETDDTSVLDQDLPALGDLLINSTRILSAKTRKRNATSPRSSTRKRRGRNIVNSDPVEEEDLDKTATPATLASPSFRSPRPLLFDSDSRGSRTLTRNCADTSLDVNEVTNPKGLGDRPTYVLSSDEETERELQKNKVSSQSRTDLSESESESISGSDRGTVTLMSRRIHGVLPASWLRLDQQAGREKATKSIKSRSLHRSPERESRRGVAQVRQALPSNDIIPVFFDESEDASDEGTAVGRKGLFDSQTRLNASRNHAFDPVDRVTTEDDDASIMEDDHIDYMPPAKSPQKRQMALGSIGGEKRGSKQRKHQSPGQRHFKSHQTTLRTHLCELTVPGQGRISDPLRSQPGRDSGKHKRKVKLSPPRLSILDVLQPDAPQFLRIAARTVKGRRNQGRSSPRKKNIQLATRQDQLDVVLVLNRWRIGAIKQRKSVTEAARSRLEIPGYSASKELPANRAAKMSAVGLTKAQKSRKLVKQISAGGSVRYLPSYTERAHTKHTPRQESIKRTTSSTSIRPAQLEMDEEVHMTKFEFHSRKRFLDRLYKNGRSGCGISELSGNAPSSIMPTQSPASDSSSLLAVNQKPPSRTGRGRSGSHFRKQTIPRRIDTQAPQYVHANDPVSEMHSREPNTRKDHDSNKLLGLGPYGTFYTHHFEIFPLNPDVFFHESTLLGSGDLEFCANLSFSGASADPTPLVSFTMREHIISWGMWDDRISSEFGIVLDYIAESLETRLSRESDTGDTAPNPVAASDFLLKYVKDAPNYVDEDCRLAFLSRIRESLENFHKRISSVLGTVAGIDHQWDGVLRVYDRLLLIALIALKFCWSNSNFVVEQFPVESLLQSLAGTSISILTQMGISNLQSLYAKLGAQHFRERGIGTNCATIHSWVMIMQVLDMARIPRASFWDITQKHIAPIHQLASTNAQDHEQIWENMFTLLPCVEFGTSGVIIPGKRHDTSSDGWAIPQKLLKHVFGIYQNNSRQAAGFNNYCRALVARCHYLVKEWGWQKCVSVVGLIFDFFGSQQLAHLRNEEVHKSPRFLDNLANQPSLEVEVEDRCFHVFLKLIAVAIRKFRVTNSVKDIGNLVARTVPNHNRQHLNDQNVHSRDLAALRNHHDLLCTLFWAAPPDYRPALSLIQNLVLATSHKEACLINIRAWTQLARFVIATGEAVSPSFRPFHAWRMSFFEQALQQFDSVASNVALQIAALGKETSQSISKEMVNMTIKFNKTAVMDVLYSSTTASLDVMRHAPDLVAASFAMNTTQMRTIFTRFSVAPADLEWGILRACLATLDSMLSHIDVFKADEDSQQSESQILNSAVGDDALMALDEELSQSFFSMARCLLSPRAEDKSSPLQDTSRANCAEQVVTIAARLCMRFINGGVMRVSRAFEKGKYQLFNGPPRMLDLNRRRYLVLFASTLLQYGMDDFEDASFSLLEFWILSLTKPRAWLKYETRLAQQLHHHGKAFVPEAVADLAISPDYNTNRGLFEYAITSMRKSIRNVGPDLQRILTAEHSSTLKAAMEQIKCDLKAITHEPAEHNAYVHFVQSIIFLIKVQGSEFCAVDDYFYQTSREYSPSMDDPRLRLANLMSYGLRLQEGDSRSGQMLYFLLFNNIKHSIATNELSEEVCMLKKGMSDRGIKTFVLSKMLPATIVAAFRDTTAFPLLDTYVEVLRHVFTWKSASQELLIEDVPAVCVLLRAILAGMTYACANPAPSTERGIHVLGQVIAIGNMMWPSLYTLSLSKAADSPSWPALWALLSDIWKGMPTAEASVQHFNRDVATDEGYPIQSILADFPRGQSDNLAPDLDVENFAENIVQDVRKNWTVNDGRITVHIPAQSSGPRMAQGVEYTAWDTHDVMDDVHGQIKEWCWWWRRANGQSPLQDTGSVVF